ncbi:FAD-binding protein [Streptomyces sparsogenes]|uniref:FAD-binding protein n=1 Tax=Streptomyces sparsogenes TaxID=67365 RepID=UPI0033D348FD
MTGPSEHQPGLRTVALIKQVPLEGGTGELAADGRLRRTGLATEINPWCRRALAQAVRLAAGPAGNSTVVTMGPPSAVDALREALACGVDEALHLCDPGWAGADCLVTAKALSAAVTSLGPVDLVVVGRSSVDGNTGAVGAMVAELLGLPFVGAALAIDVDRSDEGVTLHTTVQSDEGSRSVHVALPAVVAIAERSCHPAKAPAELWPAASRIRTVTTSQLGDGRPAQSPTQVTQVCRQPRSRTPVMLRGPVERQAEEALDLWEARQALDPAPAGAPPGVPPRGWGDTFSRVVVLTGQPGGVGPQALLGEAAVLAAPLGAQVAAVVGPGTDPGPLASWGADELIVLEDDAPRPAAAALASWIGIHGMPLALLGAARSWEREVLSRLAVRFDSGLMTDLTRVATHTDGEGRIRVRGRKPSGQGAVAEIASRGPLQIASLRTGFLELRTPRAHSAGLPAWDLAVGAEPAVRCGPWRQDDDYDTLERAEIVIGVGLGVEPGRYAELLPLCRLLDAELAATRKVTDAGWLPHSRQLGITARSIAPRLYIALGTSGNTRHMSGVERAATVIAVNHDAGAPVFDHSDIGMVADWGAAVRALTAAVERRGETRAPKETSAMAEGRR